MGTQVCLDSLISGNTDYMEDSEFLWVLDIIRKTEINSEIAVKMP